MSTPVKSLTKDEVIRRLVAYQACDFLHGYTCGNDGGHPPLKPGYDATGEHVALTCETCGWSQTLPPDMMILSVEDVQEHAALCLKLFSDIAQE